MTTATVTPITRKSRTRAAAKPADDTKPTVTAAELNAATTANRLAAARGQGASAKSVTGTNKPAGSTPAKPATPAKGKTGPAPKPAPAPKPKANSVIAAAVIANAAEFLTHWDPKAHDGISKADAIAAASKWLAYLPACDWPTKVLGPRSDAGRRRTS